LLFVGLIKIIKGIAKSKENLVIVTWR